MPENTRFRGAIVETDPANIGENVQIGEFAIVRAGAVLGDGVIIHPHVIVGDGVVLGKNVEVFPGALLGRVPKGAGATARQPSFERTIFIGESSSIGPHAIVYYDVRIGRNTLIGDGASIREQCVIGSYCIVSRYVTINYNTRLGDRTKVMDLTHLTGNMILEEDVFVSTMVGTTNDNVVSGDYAEARIVGPHLKRGCIVGAGATLLPATVVGEGALVGAGAVVTRSVDPRQVVMGAPARVVKTLDPA